MRPKVANIAGNDQEFKEENSDIHQGPTSSEGMSAMREKFAARQQIEHRACEVYVQRGCRGGHTWRFTPVSRIASQRPRSAPWPAHNQNGTRIAPAITPAPPTRAAKPPRSARNTSEVPETRGISPALGAMAVTHCFLTILCAVYVLAIIWTSFGYAAEDRITGNSIAASAARLRATSATGRRLGVRPTFKAPARPQA